VSSGARVMIIHQVIFLFGQRTLFAPPTWANEGFVFLIWNIHLAVYDMRHSLSQSPGWILTLVSAQEMIMRLTETELCYI
jgi:hypothetical protein